MLLHNGLYFVDTFHADPLADGEASLKELLVQALMQESFSKSYPSLRSG